jgi:hypothetical protein
MKPRRGCRVTRYHVVVRRPGEAQEYLLTTGHEFMTLATSWAVEALLWSEDWWIETRLRPEGD